jgi:AGCS family alanine or glycine:cation symporter
MEFNHMEYLLNAFNGLNGIVWGAPMLALILGTGLFLMFLLKFMPLRKIGAGFALLWSGRTTNANENGDISPFQALMTCLAATVGTGNIAGVATAIFMGGPGALFWMWCTALVGMATKYSEVLLAVHYREKDKNGEYIGGPMFAIKNGLGKRWVWLGTAFAIFGGLAGFGIGNMVQVNSMAQALDSTLHIPTWITGVITTIIVAMVTLDGVKRIGKVAEALVPFMCVAYIIAGVVVLVVNAAVIPDAVALIFSSAFNPVAATGGFAGATMMLALQAGVARGVFSNESGLGSAPIAAAAAKTDSCVEQGLVCMTGTFFDTIIICTMTGITLVLTGSWQAEVAGTAMTNLAFTQGIGSQLGFYLVNIGLLFFAFTTIIGWNYYGERCTEYLLGVNAIKPYRWIFVVLVAAGAFLHLDLIWIIADIVNGLMAIPNLIGLIGLRHVIAAETFAYFSAKDTTPDNAETEASM